MEYYKEVFVTLVSVTICMNEGAKSNIWASDTCAVFFAGPDDIPVLETGLSKCLPIVPD